MSIIWSRCVLKATDLSFFKKKLLFKGYYLSLWNNAREESYGNRVHLLLTTTVLMKHTASAEETEELCVPMTKSAQKFLLYRKWSARGQIHDVSCRWRFGEIISLLSWLQKKKNKAFGLMQGLNNRKFHAWNRALGTTQRNGMGGGAGRGGLGWGTHVHPWLIHDNVWQKPPRYCKVISLQLKKVN